MKIKKTNISTKKTEFTFTDNAETIGISSIIDKVYTKILIYKLSERFIVRINVKYSLRLKCDICLEEYVSNHDEILNLIVTTEDSIENQDDISEEYLFFDENDEEIDFTKYIKETILLSIPFKKKCKPDCKGLCPVCGKNKNYYECSHKIVNIDPRFEKLKEIREKLKLEE